MSEHVMNFDKPYDAPCMVKMREDSVKERDQ